MDKMKSLFLSSLLVVVSTSGLAQNPIIQTNYTADPAPMVYNDKVYLYTTHDEDNSTWFTMNDWRLYTTSDMVNWTDHGAVLSYTDFSWAKGDAWAPQCIERGGKFYMYVPMISNINNRGAIGVAVADSPYGPFYDPLGKPLVQSEWGDIDPTVFIDDDGQAYLYWGNPNLYYVKLNEDMISCAGEITKDKQIRKIENQKDPYHFQEGPWAYKKNGHYYMAYASTCCPEGIGYAMGPGPVGPWEFKGYIMKPNGKSSGNHPGIIDYKGKSYVFGFNYRLNFMITDKHHERRSICVAELEYNPDGTIKELPWWDDGVGVAPVGTLNPYKRTEAETMAWSQGLKTAKDDESGIYVTSIHNRDFLQVKAVDFGKGAKTFEVRAATITKGKIEIRLDGLDGTLLGVCNINNTGGWNTWKTFTADVEKVGGVHDLYLVFRGGDGEMFNMDYWRFK